MNHVQSRSNINFLLIVMILAAGLSLIAIQQTRGTLQTNLGWLVRVVDEVSSVDARPLGPSGVDGFAQTKATAFPVDARPLGPSGVDGFAQIKANVSPPVDARPLGPSGVDKLQPINVKGDLIP